MGKNNSINFAVAGVSLVVMSILVKNYPMFDLLANSSFAYLAGMLGLVVLVVGVHCLIFSSSISELRIVPNIILFVMIVSAVNVNIVWEGVVLGASKKDVWLNLSNSIEFSFYYAAVLFLPRCGRKVTPQATLTPEPDSE